MSTKRFSDFSGVELTGDWKPFWFRLQLNASHLEDGESYERRWDMTSAEMLARKPAWDAFYATITQAVITFKNAVEGE